MLVAEGGNAVLQLFFAHEETWTNLVMTGQDGF